MEWLVPSKGSALDDLLGRTVKPLGAHLAAAVEPPTTDGGLGVGNTQVPGNPGATSGPRASHRILPPAALICLKNAIELEYNQ